MENRHKKSKKRDGKLKVYLTKQKWQFAVEGQGLAEVE
jgi:hypothetical protein